MSESSGGLEVSDRPFSVELVSGNNVRCLLFLLTFPVGV